MDDAFDAIVEFENGAVGTLEASRFAAGRKNHEVFEINGSKGSMRFNLERFNELEVFWTDAKPRETQGFTDVLISEVVSPVLVELVATGAHHRLGAYLCP